MMMNLFSIFDPSTFCMNIFPWIFMLMSLFILLTNNFLSMKFNFYLKILLKFINNEIVPLLGIYNMKGMLSYFLVIFLSLLMVNFFSLFPFYFTVSAHIIMAFPLAFLVWLLIMMFGCFNNSKMMMIHMVPLGTPLVLMNFMVMIELISNFIRPITLSVRLTANMVAGHLLLSLLGSFSLMSNMNFIFSFMGMMILCMLELAVSMIQSYVFMTLITLYSTEVLYE